MRREIILLAVTLSLSSLAFAYDWSTNPGDGSAENPYQISTPEQLISVGFNGDTPSYELFSKCYILTNDIDMDPAVTGMPPFERAIITPIVGPDFYNMQEGDMAFTGIFDGRGYRIMNLQIDCSNQIYAHLGLFRNIAAGAIIKNLDVTNVSIVGYPGPEGYTSYCGGLVGYTDGGIISNCFISGNIIAPRNVGGFVGILSGGWSFTEITILTNCHSTCSVTGTGADWFGTYLEPQVGGLAGIVGEKGIVSHCTATGSVHGGYLGGVGGLIDLNLGTVIDCKSSCTVTGDSYSTVGGLTGGNAGKITRSSNTGNISGFDYVGGISGGNGGTISQCYSTGNVSGDDYIGGLLGGNGGNVNNCYSTGSVSGDEYVGGFVGQNERWINNCYSTGSVSGTTCVGGFCGYQLENYPKPQNCFWNMETSGITDGVGNWDPDPNGVIGLTTAQMQIKSTFTDYGWDFVGEDVNGTNDIWRMCVDGIDYPHLSWEYSINGDFTCPDGVGTEDLLSLSNNWLNSEEVDSGFSYACDPTFDGVTNLADYVVLAENWLEGY